MRTIGFYFGFIFCLVIYIITVEMATAHNGMLQLLFKTRGDIWSRCWTAQGEASYQIYTDHSQKAVITSLSQPEEHGVPGRHIDWGGAGTPWSFAASKRTKRKWCNEGCELSAAKWTWRRAQGIRCSEMISYSNLGSTGTAETRTKAWHELVSKISEQANNRKTEPVVLVRLSVHRNFLKIFRMLVLCNGQFLNGSKIRPIVPITLGVISIISVMGFPCWPVISVH